MISTATLIIDSRVVQRIQIKRKADMHNGIDGMIGWVSVKETKFNPMSQKEETTILLEKVIETPLMLGDFPFAAVHVDDNSIGGSPTSADFETDSTGEGESTAGSPRASDAGSRGGLSTPGKKKKNSPKNTKSDDYRTENELTADDNEPSEVENFAVQIMNLVFKIMIFCRNWTRCTRMVRTGPGHN